MKVSNNCYQFYNTADLRANWKPYQQAIMNPKIIQDMFAQNLL